MNVRAWRLWRRSILLLVVVAVGSSACGGGTAPTPSRTTTPPSPASTTVRVEGTWSGEWQTDRTPEAIGSLRARFVEEGPTLSGSIRITGSGCITEGTVAGTLKGSAITFEVRKGARSIRYVGVVAGAVMSGTYSTRVCRLAGGSWTALRSAG